jgi:hypothetical protein
MTETPASHAPMSQPPQGPEAGPPAASSPADFPPLEIGAFLRFCAGEWMALRSRFALGEAPGPENMDEDSWHSSERGELLVAYLEPSDAGSPGGLRLGPKGEVPRQLLFSGDGRFTVGGSAGQQQGSWTLWPDGSLELTLNGEGCTVRERIWFTKPNLRLRSTVESRADGSPGRASFSSEIRRVSRPNG